MLIKLSFFNYYYLRKKTNNIFLNINEVFLIIKYFINENHIQYLFFKKYVFFRNL